MAARVGAWHGGGSAAAAPGWAGGGIGFGGFPPFGPMVAADPTPAGRAAGRLLMLVENTTTGQIHSASWEAAAAAAASGSGSGGLTVAVVDPEWGQPVPGSGARLGGSRRAAIRAHVGSLAASLGLALELGFNAEDWERFGPRPAARRRVGGER